MPGSAPTPAAERSPPAACLPDEPCPTRPAAEALRDPELYATIVDAFSTRNLDPGAGENGHARFFDSFSHFGPATRLRVPEMLAEVTRRAAEQHVGYLEITMTFRDDEGGFRTNEPWPFDAADLAGSLAWLEERGLAAGAARASARLDEWEGQVRELLGCAREPVPVACVVERRYLHSAARNLEPPAVFARLAFGFALAQRDPRVVGVNLVAPEDWLVARRDYGLHMRMVGWLTDHYRTVPTSLHAGELTLGLVPPEDLRFHIRDAVEVGKARRIGHGVDLAYERDALALLRELRERDVLVEILLTSNDVILGVRGDEHPFPEYLRAGVPVTLATDDEGVARIDLTHEYLRAVTTYGLGYEELKRLARNSLAYNFLPGESLWRRGGDERHAACRGDDVERPPSPPCEAFLAGSEKARLQWRLERDLAEFERLEWAAAAPAGC
jgi:adenosine deaminase